MSTVGTVKTVRVGVDGSRVLLVIEGQVRLEMSWQQADELSVGLRAKARQAEEIAKVAQVIADGALLFRSGAPFGVSNNRDVNAEIAKEAQSNRDLRRFMPSGIKSQEQFGAPTIR